MTRGALAALLLALAVGALISTRQAPREAHQEANSSGRSGGAGSGSAVSKAALDKEAQQEVCPDAAAEAPPQHSSTGGASGRGRWHSRPTGGGLFIVRFKDYKLAEEHKTMLDAALGSSPPAATAAANSWEWVDRHNPAAVYPTDFGLLRLATPESGLKSRLEGLPFVRDVHPERQITHSLLAVGGDPAAQQQQEGSLAAAPESHHAPCTATGGSSGSSGDEQQQQEEQEEQQCVSKRPGRLQTRPTFSLEDNLDAEGDVGAAPAGGARVANDTFAGTGASVRRRRSLLQMNGKTLASILMADQLWAQGFKGQGVRMGVFDTGIRGDHPDVKHIEERTNWTHEPTLDDGLGHGSFVAGVIAGTDLACPGLAPEVLLHTFRVFTNDQVSYTSWFLDAFNYAMATKMNIVNLSIGGPDFLDFPFVEKVAEITSSGIIMVSAIGNDGPLYGTLNNPADQNDVIGIGGIDYGDNIAPFSSRGMSTWEVPLGYGRSKPDVMAYGRDVQGSRIGGGCRSLSGTSVASPVVAGAVCLLSSVVPADKRWDILNPASMKQALVEGAIRLPGLNLYEQGAGKLSVVNSKTILERYIPRASLVPRKLNFTDCPYMWPFCTQPLYAGSMPIMFNATILNGQGLTGRLEEPPTWTPADEGGRLLDVQFEYSQQLWPWSGYLALFLRVKEEGASFSGTGNGEFRFVVASPPVHGERQPRRSIVRVPVTAAIIPTPPRSKRVLWDQFHSIRYPPAYFPRDDLQVRHDILDWHGDHPHTNYHEMYNALREEGFFLEVLASPATCFNASNYGSLMIVDSEDEFYREEVAKLAADVEAAGMGLLIFADWYHEESIQKLRFYDDNTRSWWEAATGGANVPALNDLLVPFRAAFEQGALEAEVDIEGLAGQGSFHMASGVTIKAMPAGAWLHRTTPKQKEGQPAKQGSGVLALFQHGKGRVGLYGDSNCLDSSHSRSTCFALLAHMLRWAAGEDVPALTPASGLHAGPYGTFESMPARRPDFNFTEVSPVLMKPIKCYPNSPLAFHGATFQHWNVPVSRPVRKTVVVEQPAAAGVGDDAAAAPGNGTAAGVAAQGQEGGAGTAGEAAGGQQQQAQTGAATATQEQQQEQQQPGGNATAVAQQPGAAAAQQQAADPGAAAQQQATPATQAADPAAAQQAAAQQAEAEKQAAVTGAAAKQAADAEAAKQAAAADAAAAAAKQAAAQQAVQQAAVQQQQAEQEEIKKQQDLLLKLKGKEEVAKTQQGTADGAGDGTAAGDSSTTDESGREHPDINSLAQAGEEGPQHVEDTSRPKQAADGSLPDGEGAAARISSRLRQQTAAATVDGGASGWTRSSSYTQSLVLEGGMLCAIAGVLLWSRSRRRRGLPARLTSRRWRLPLWGSGARDRHE